MRGCTAVLEVRRSDHCAALLTEDQMPIDIRLNRDLQALDMMTRGHQLADMSANIGSLDIVFGEIDR